MSEDWSSRGAEARRRAILASYPVARPEIADQLDRIARLAAEFCGTPIGLVSLVESERQWFIGRSGFDTSETPREYAFCDLAMHSDAGMEVKDTLEDVRFSHNPLVTGQPGIRFYASHPLRSLEGAPLGTVCVIDTQPRPALSAAQREGLRTLAEAAMGLLERWRLDSRSKAQAAESKTALHDLEQRFRVLADAMPQMVWSSLASGRTDYFNRLWCEYSGAPAEDSFGDAWMQFLHPDDREQVKQVWREAVNSGGTYDVEYRLRRHDGAYRWMLVRGLPIKDQAGGVSRWIGTCTDIQQQKALSEQQELLTRELSHRIKNIFAVISGLITLSLRRRPELTETGRELQQRVLALGRAHDFVRPHSEYSRPYVSHSSLVGMLDSLLDAYQDAERQRVRITGEDVRIDDRSATPLALFFHELATNAAKYGALSSIGGHIDITITCGDTIALDWAESGGPPAPSAVEPGFGASLIEMSVVRQLGGKLDYDWKEEGVRVSARIPAKAMSR